MTELEGVIKYRLEYTKRPFLLTESLENLNAWRSICHRLNLIGQDLKRYQGYGFGNISQRTKPGDLKNNQDNDFIISGTQTGAMKALRAQHYCRVLAADTTRNLIIAEGPIKPSSEALTHAAVYAASSATRCVIHVHSPEIWRNSLDLGITTTGGDIAYGTPQMAEAVRNLIQSGELDNHAIFAMLGHQDGIVTFGKTVRQAGQILIDYLALALCIQS